MRQSYREISNHMRPVSYLSEINNEIAATIVYLCQNLPLQANAITFFSFLLVLAAIPFLFFDHRIIFIVLLILSYTFDNVDGIWARFKKQTSEFGGFFDPFLDKAKDYLIDLSFILYYLNSLSNYSTDFKLALTAISLYFIFKGLFYAARDHNLSKTATAEKRKIKLLRYGGAEKFIIIYPLLSFSFPFFIIYILGYFSLYFVGIFTNLYKTALSINK